MAFQLKQLTVPCLLSILLLLSSISFSFAKTEPCTCSDSEQDRRSNHTVTTDGAGLKIILINRDSGVLHTDIHSLSNGAVANSTGVLSTFDRWIQLWQRRPDGRLGVDEASFSFNIVYNPLRTTPTASYSGLAFLILPRDALGLPGEALGYLEAENGSLARQLVSGDVGTVDLFDATSRNASLSGASVSVKIGTVQAANLPNGSRIMGVDVTVNLAADVSSRYDVWSAWIDYDRVGRTLSVYVDVAGNPKPDNAIAEVARLNLSSVITSAHIYFGVLSTVDQVLRSAVRWNATIEDLPRYDVDKGGGGFLSRKVTILSSVLGSVATTAMLAAGVAFYFNSKYRRWHKDLDQLARSMERLPGVPTKVEFSEIKKPTGNFHETMKLGGGGFGTVYRCTLPATASKKERPMDIAVKRFIRDLRNRRYDDFLAEVSIINRLRHKNIVPLIGWSYNKGEPLLLFEFMTNGSLDKHLFPKYGNGSSIGQRRHTGFALRRWATRYEIVRDIATGLHYVHHEYEPMVLHRDIKASNVMLDSSFCARLGDFGLSCTIAMDRNSATGVAGTWGYIAPEYAMCGKATRQTDIYALGVLILEVVTGQRALQNKNKVVDDDDDIHITDRVWHFHREGRLLECVDDVLITASSLGNEEELDAGGEAERLLLLGLSCTSPNALDRPTMADVVRVIAKSAPPPEVPPEKPRFVWPPAPGEEGCSVAFHDDSTGGTSSSMMSYLDKSTTSMGKIGLGQPVVQARAARRHASFQILQHSVYSTASSARINVS
uniref:Uncharacterized protein n=1 Tax=Avena sativa TaxID=4498 RepID=A0ACD5WD65_AVESA